MMARSMRNSIIIKCTMTILGKRMLIQLSRILVVTVIFTLFGIKTFAQNSPQAQHYLDSIRPFINNNRYSNPTGVLDVLYKAEKINRDSVLMERIYMAIITTSASIGQLEISKAYLQKHRVLALILNSQEDLFYNYSNAGLSFFSSGDYDSAMIYYKKALVAAELSGKSKAATKVNVGLLLETIGDTNNAIRLYREALIESFESLKTEDDTFYRKQIFGTAVTSACNLLVYANSASDTTNAAIGQRLINTLLTEYKSELESIQMMEISSALSYIALKQYNYHDSEGYAKKLYEIAIQESNIKYKHRAIDLLVRNSLNTQGENISYKEALALLWNIENNVRQDDLVSFTLFKSLLHMKLSRQDSAIFYYDRYVVLNKFHEEIILNVRRDIEYVLPPSQILKSYESDFNQLNRNSNNKPFGRDSALIIMGTIAFVIMAIVMLYFLRKRRVGHRQPGN